MLRPRERNVILPELESAQYVLQQEEESGDWDCGGGKRDGRYGVSGYGAAIVAPRRVRVDDEVVGIYSAGVFDRVQYLDEAEASAEKGGGVG